MCNLLKDPSTSGTLVAFSFLSDKPGDDSVTVVDVLTGMSLSVVIPTKSRTTYSQAELRRFVLETGRTFGVLQCDPEPALRNIAEAVTGEASKPALDPSFGVDAPDPSNLPMPSMPELFGDSEDEQEAMEEDFPEPEAAGEASSSALARSSTDAGLCEPPALRPRLEEALPFSPTKRSTETLDVGTSKVQRIASLTFDRKKRTLPVCDFRVAAVTTKSDLEVPVHVNQDERELLLAKTLENPQVWYETEFPYEEEVAGMKKEMLSMKNFDVFDEVPTSSLSEEALSEAISTRWVKVRKSDGTVRCRIVVRGYTQQVDDRDELFASTPSLTTLKLLLTLSSAFGWHIATGDVSTAFLHAAVDGDIYVIRLWSTTRKEMRSGS